MSLSPVPSMFLPEHPLMARLAPLAQTGGMLCKPLHARGLQRMFAQDRARLLSFSGRPPGQPWLTIAVPAKTVTNTLCDCPFFDCKAPV